VAAVVDGDDAGSIIHRADAALYRSKHLGRNQVQSEQPSSADVLATTSVPAGAAETPCAVS
jgi:hypothetical protein